MKRAFDILASVSLIILLIPVLFILTVIQWVNFGKPLFFSQDRAGKDGCSFLIIKFRTMQEGSASDSERLTPWGQFMRSTSLDELPELWNVIKGEMSLVGPRPLPTVYLKRYTTEQARRHMLRPGITGWAQVNGRNGLSWKRQFELDLWYIDNRSFLLDLKIIGLTLFTVLGRKNVNQAGHSTRSEFLGKEEE